MVSAAERARRDVLKRAAKREKRFAGMSVKEAVAAHNKSVDAALDAAKKGAVISLTDLMISQEQIAKKKGLI